MEEKRIQQLKKIRQDFDNLENDLVKEAVEHAGYGDDLFFGIFKPIKYQSRDLTLKEYEEEGYNDLVAHFLKNYKSDFEKQQGKNTPFVAEGSFKEILKRIYTILDQGIMEAINRHFADATQSAKKEVLAKVIDKCVMADELTLDDMVDGTFFKHAKKWINFFKNEKD